MGIMNKLPTVSWTFPGAPKTSTREEWPRWVVFMNFAYDAEKFVIHDWDGKHVARVGDTIVMNSVGKITIVPAKDIAKPV